MHGTCAHFRRMNNRTYAHRDAHALLSSLAQELKALQLDGVPPLEPPVAVKAEEGSSVPVLPLLVGSLSPSAAASAAPFLSSTGVSAYLPPAPAGTQRLFACSLGTGFVGTFEEVQAHEQRILAQQVRVRSFRLILSPSFG